jgi:hypothetical protein
MESRDDVIKKIDVFTDQLSNRLTGEDLENGWTEENKQVILEFFRELRDKVLNNEQVSSLHVSRRLDAWGIVDGSLLKFAEEIGEAIEKLA